MLKYLRYAIQALFVLGGISLGLWMKTGAAPGAHVQPPATPHQVEDAHGDTARPKASDIHKSNKKSHTGDKKKKGGHGGGVSEDSSFGYLKFSRQFIVPVVGASGVKSLVVMDINIEMPPEATEGAYTREPKLRDALLGALLNLSNRGAFSEQLLEQSNIDIVRGELLEAARTIIGKDAQNVLILSIARQDV